MAGRVDLDAVERDNDRYGLDQEQGAALVAELRAAREVVDRARKAAHAVDLVGTTDYSARVLFDLGQAVDAYDQAIGRPAAADLADQEGGVA